MKKILTLLGLLVGSMGFAQDNVVAAPSAFDTTFSRVEVEASFPGGLSAWSAFLSQNLRSNVPIRKKAPAGTYNVIVQFIVDKTGLVTDIKSLTNHGYGMEEEVVRVIRRSPRWSPARQNGRMVKAYRQQPLTFVVEGK
ncbi:MAG: energy transducer TonB [Flaviaesturariibacter sp.]|nr:energy transducer TonB [Flaviaesturariibacter sp.]